ncbi:MAG: hypothetical protein IJB97_10240 [Clostridia bacterium]|nr:hypothetical protein [Clostridia bacterium]
MMRSKVERIGGVPTLTVNGEPIAETAYMTYYVKNGRYDDFSKIGYRLYSVPLLFSSMPLNDATQFPPFTTGIYDGDEPNYALIDEAIGKVLKACPNAYIFPRVNLSLPRKWEDEHPDELCDFGFTEHKRVCFSSDLWAEETKRLLRDFIGYVEKSKYRENIIGYQLAGGNTEEWFSFDLKGSVGKRSREGYEKYCKENGEEKSEEGYYRYLSLTVANRLCEFARTAKECVDDRLVVGTFYGYTLECPARTSCHHALARVLACKDIDFICSPISYANYRLAGQDHANMLPVDSLKLHGKLYFSECDQRTHLTRPPNDLPAYNTWIWQPTEKQPTKEVLKLLFSRALTHGHAMWWFDMWGGWYADEEYLALMKRAKEIAAESLSLDRKSAAKTAVFIDENCYASLPETDKGVPVGCYFRYQLGQTGVPYDIYLASDFERVIDGYEAALFLVPVETPLIKACINKAKEKKIPVIVIDRDNMGMTVDELIDLYKNSGVQPYTNKKSVVYDSAGYVFLHTSEDGEYDFSAQGKKTFTDEFTGRKYTFPVTLPKGESLLFKKTGD